MAWISPPPSEIRCLAAYLSEEEDIQAIDKQQAEFFKKGLKNSGFADNTLSAVRFAGHIPLNDYEVIV